MNLGNKLKTHNNALQLKSYIEDIKLKQSEDKRRSIDKILADEDNKLSDIVSGVLESNEIDESNPDSVIQFLDKVISQIDSLEKVDLTVAVEPTEELIRSISDWVQEEVQENLLIDIEVDPDVLGGVKLSYKGNYLDLSLDKKLKETFENKDINLK